MAIRCHNIQDLKFQFQIKSNLCVTIPTIGFPGFKRCWVPRLGSPRRLEWSHSCSVSVELKLFLCWNLGPRTRHTMYQRITVRGRIASFPATRHHTQPIHFIAHLQGLTERWSTKTTNNYSIESAQNICPSKSLRWMMTWNQNFIDLVGSSKIVSPFGKSPGFLSKIFGCIEIRDPLPTQGPIEIGPTKKQVCKSNLESPIRMHCCHCRLFCGFTSPSIFACNGRNGWAMGQEKIKVLKYIW